MNVKMAAQIVTNMLIAKTQLEVSSASVVKVTGETDTIANVSFIDVFNFSTYVNSSSSFCSSSAHLPSIPGSGRYSLVYVSYKLAKTLLYLINVIFFNFVMKCLLLDPVENQQ